MLSYFVSLMLWEFSCVDLLLGLDGLCGAASYTCERQEMALFLNVHNFAFLVRGVLAAGHTHELNCSN